MSAEVATLCFKCGETWDSSDEKMTDITVAVHLLEDAYDNAFDTARLILISDRSGWSLWHRRLSDWVTKPFTTAWTGPRGW
jgi:hypothetical protein